MTGSRFRLGSTSYVYPGDLICNAERLAGQVSDIELVLFDTEQGACNLPTVHEVIRLKAIALAHGLSYTVHLPHDLETGIKRQQALNSAKRVIALTALLDPYAIVFHIASADAGSPRWTQSAIEQVDELTGLCGDPGVLALENLERYDPELLLPIFHAVPISRTLDIGHLWKSGRDPLPLLDQWLPSTRVVHLHGMAHTDHVSLDTMPPERLDPVMRKLLGFPGVLTLEVFEDDFFTSRNALYASVQRLTATTTCDS